MPYTAVKPSRARTSDELRATIPGWGADLDPAVRPSYPRERLEVPVTDTMPEQQQHEGYRERSIEHARLTPVFGTVAPLHGLSGWIRRLAYDRYSEGRALHWLLLVLGDRVDSAASGLRSFASLRPDNPITETGVLAELKRGGLRSRVGRGRIDLKHTWIDPILVAGPFVLGAVVLWRVTRPLRRRR
ncbi:MAG TPA: hypothetical protein VNR36_10180 [Pseudolysinimonas sp.]|nr:hypothetical protein [Pseudolysinimonas sp.]